MSTVLEDLTKLSPKRLERRLEELAGEALQCVGASAFDANPQDGLTVGLWIEADDRRDVLDLARVLESEPGGHVSTGWSLLSPSRNHPYWRLLLRAQFERPVKCSFAVRFDVHKHASDEMRVALPLLLAASGFALGFNGFPEPDGGATWLPAPRVRDCVAEVIAAGLGA